MDNKEELIPLEQVLDDMYDPNGGMAADAARCYYYEHYATDLERKQMDHEDKVHGIVANVIMAVYVVVVIAAIIVGIIQG